MAGPLKCQTVVVLSHYQIVPQCIKVLFYAPVSKCLEASISLTVTALESAHCEFQAAEIQSPQAQNKNT
jgi:hypothetical protein